MEGYLGVQSRVSEQGLPLSGMAELSLQGGAILLDKLDCTGSCKKIPAKFGEGSFVRTDGLCTSCQS